jgi:hypothetical protein
MMRRGLVALIPAIVGAAGATALACTDVATDPNAVVAVRFEGSAYPSIVVGDSLRDSLGARQPIFATGLNYKGEAIAGAEFVFSSPDTNLRVVNNGMVFARSRKTDGSPARVFATAGSLQSQPDSLLIVPRADSIKAAQDVDTAGVLPAGSASTGLTLLPVSVFGDTLAGAPKAGVPGWLVSFQLRYHGVLLPPTDTSTAFTFVTVGSGVNTSLKATFVDSTDASGKAERGVFVQSIPAAVTRDTIYLIATIQARKAGVAPKKDTTMILILR